MRERGLPSFRRPRLEGGRARGLPSPSPGGIPRRFPTLSLPSPPGSCACDSSRGCDFPGCLQPPLPPPPPSWTASVQTWDRLGVLGPRGALCLVGGGGSHLTTCLPLPGTILGTSPLPSSWFPSGWAPSQLPPPRGSSSGFLADLSSCELATCQDGSNSFSSKRL